MSCHGVPVPRGTATRTRPGRSLQTNRRLVRKRREDARRLLGRVRGQSRRSPEPPPPPPCASSPLPPPPPLPPSLSEPFARCVSMTCRRRRRVHPRRGFLEELAGPSSPRPSPPPRRPPRPYSRSLSCQLPLGRLEPAASRASPGAYVARGGRRAPSPRYQILESTGWSAVVSSISLSNAPPLRNASRRPRAPSPPSRPCGARGRGGRARARARAPRGNAPRSSPTCAPNQPREARASPPTPPCPAPSRRGRSRAASSRRRRRSGRSRTNRGTEPEPRRTGR